MKHLCIYMFFISFSVFASDTLEVNGKKFSIKINEISCIKGAADLFDRTSKTIYDEMTKAGCRIQSDVGFSVDCSKIDNYFLLRGFILSKTRERNYCNCKAGPIECVNYCSKILQVEECQALCSGNCSISYPAK